MNSVYSFIKLEFMIDYKNFNTSCRFSRRNMSRGMAPISFSRSFFHTTVWFFKFHITQFFIYFTYFFRTSDCFRKEKWVTTSNDSTFFSSPFLFSSFLCPYIYLSLTAYLRTHVSLFLCIIFFPFFYLADYFGWAVARHFWFESLCSYRIPDNSF